MKNMNAGKKGFTLIEVLLVIAILVTLASVGVVAYTKIQAGANIDATKVLVSETAHAVEVFYANMNRYPTDDKGLNELITPPDDDNEKPKWKGPYLNPARIPLDPWGNELKYQYVPATSSGSGSGGVSATDTFHVWSLGPDKQDGTDDDIKSWIEEKK